jgi:hypothetical protein
MPLCVVRTLLLFVALSSTTAGCAAATSNVLWYDKTRVLTMRTVAVLPLENLTDNNDAAEVVTNQFTTALYGEKKYRILEKNEVVRRLKAAKVEIPAVIDRRTAHKLGEALHVDGVFFGSVTEFGYLFYPEDAVIGMRLFLVDVNTGNVVWSALCNHKNKGVFDGTYDSLTELGQEASAHVVLQLQPAPEAHQ